MEPRFSELLLITMSFFLYYVFPLQVFIHHCQNYWSFAQTMTNTLPFTIFLLCLLCLNYLFFFFIPQAASTPLNPLSFQCEFVKLRIDLLQAFSQLICTCNSLKTSPPPAIATTIAMTLGNDLQRCGRISNQACLNFIFSAVFIYTLEVFEVSCEIKKF